MDSFCNALYLDSVLLYMLVLTYVIVVIKRVSYHGRLKAATTTNNLLVKKNLMELLELYIRNTAQKGSRGTSED